jgi:lipopolysaccharide/colanic/teichoic acid biosynthesis glycosyltransferase
MIIRSHQQRNPLWRRILRATIPATPPPCSGVVSEEVFRFELARETSRSNRRPSGREFAIVILQVVEQNDSHPWNELVTGLSARLRISDTIGWFHGKLAILLPETDQQGAMLVANDVAKLGLLYSLRIDTEIRVYPWDDELVNVADELRADRHIENSAMADETVPDHSGELINAESDSEPALCVGSRALNDLHDPRKMRSAMFAFQPTIKTPWWKRTTDIVGSSVGLICLSPVFAVAAIAIKLDGAGPVFFKQQREGKDGRCFHIWKFRTMHRDADDLKEDLRHISEQDGPAFKLADDPRVTRVGRYLRKSCIDELPQLINVLRGEMSLVGPRPLPVNESVACKTWQRHRLRVLPGLTCIWQVEGSRKTKFDDWMRMDREYLRHRSFVFDLKLIFRTAVLAVMHRGSV